MTYEVLKTKKICLIGTKKRCLDIQAFFCELTFTKEFFLTEYGFDPIEKGVVTAYIQARKGKELLILSETAPNAAMDEPLNTEQWLSDATSNLSYLLTEMGLVRGTDYLWLDDLLEVTREIETFYLQKTKAGRKVCVYGEDEMLRDLIDQNPSLSIAYMTWAEGTDRIGSFPAGCQEITFEELCRLDRDKIYVVLAMPVNQATKNKFAQAGFIFGKEFHFYNPRRPKHPTAYYLKKTMYDSPKYTMACNYSSSPVSIKNHGHLMSCCSAISLHLGNCKFTSIEEIFKGVQAQIINLSTNNRTYSFCSDMCWSIREKAHCLLNKEEIENNSRRYDPLRTVPEFCLQLCYDRSCNLACPQCRTHSITQPEESKEIVDMIHEEVKRACSLHPKNVRVGNEELFFSRYYRDIIYNCYESEDIEFITNGQLFNQENWEKLQGRYKNISLMVSIDAATEETYKKLRGGNFDRLLKNLEFASRLRQENQLKCLSILFVIQAENFEEMKDFVKYGNSIHADFIYFTKLNRWGHISEEQFALMDVYKPQNIHHEKFVEILQDPIFQQSNVHIVNIKNFIKR